VKAACCVVVASLCLAACSERPHDGVKLLPRPALPAPGGVAAVAQAEPPAAVAPARAVGQQATTPLPTTPAEPAPAVPALLPAPLPGRLDGAAAPLLVLPGEPTGNDRFRQALQEKLERQAATP